MQRQVKTVRITQLINGEKPNRGNTFISGYQSDKPNYQLSNFAPRENQNVSENFVFADPDIGIIHLPTAEHYLHFQQLNIISKQAMINKGWANARAIDILRGKLNPDSPWYIGPDQLHDSIKTNGAYDDGKWIDKSITIQIQINATKYQQSEAFRFIIDEAISLGALLDGGDAATIIEDTSSTNALKPENKWGTGPKGEGLNMLGNSQTAFANMIKQNAIYKQTLTARNATPPKHQDIKDRRPDYYYRAAESQFSQGGVQEALKDARCNFPNANKQTDTADLGPEIVQNYHNTTEVINARNHRAQPTQRGYQIHSTHTTRLPTNQKHSKLINKIELLNDRLDADITEIEYAKDRDGYYVKITGHEAVQKLGELGIKRNANHTWFHLRPNDIKRIAKLSSRNKLIEFANSELARLRKPFTFFAANKIQAIEKAIESIQSNAQESHEKSLNKASYEKLARDSGLIHALSIHRFSCSNKAKNHMETSASENFTRKLKEIF